MDSKTDRNILIAISVLCVFLIGITAIKSQWIAPLRSGVGLILTPIQKGVNVAGKAFYNSIEERNALKQAYEENKALKTRIDELSLKNTELEEENLELQRLRELYKLDEEYNDYEKIGARVIAKDSGRWFKVFRIDKGSQDGIEVDMNVIADGGLVGIVSDVGTNYATVRSIIDDVSRVSAMAMQSGNNCIVAGDLRLYEEGRLKLGDIDVNADIKDGDKIVTSNISTKFLPGILIGYAKDINVDNSRLTKSGYLIPVASFDTLQEVLIITKQKETGEAK
jgi:rod shape-determining protein mreC